MRAMILSQAQSVDTSPLEAVELSPPAPGRGEVRVLVHTCGVCRTDLHVVEGELELPKLPLIPGHQIVGLVDRVGENVTQFHQGDRVGVPWLNSTCGRCVFCRQGKENLCPSARFTGFHADGGYAQYVVVSEDYAYHLPQGLSDTETAPLLCAGVIGYRALRLSDVRPGERLGLYGFGGSAHIVIQIARYWDCEVYVFTRSQEHQRLARELGAAWVGGAQDTPPKTINSGIIFAPAGWIVLEALRVLERGGTLSLAGIYMSPIPEMDYNLLYHEHTIRSAANSTREDVRELLRLAGEIPIRTEVEVFPLEAANEALQRLKRSEIKGAGVLEIPHASSADER